MGVPLRERMEMERVDVDPELQPVEKTTVRESSVVGLKGQVTGTVKSQGQDLCVKSTEQHRQDLLSSLTF